jgi:hypothetical protein
MLAKKRKGIYAEALDDRGQGIVLGPLVRPESERASDEDELQLDDV